MLVIPITVKMHLLISAVLVDIQISICEIFVQVMASWFVNILSIFSGAYAPSATLSVVIILYIILVETKMK